MESNGGKDTWSKSKRLWLSLLLFLSFVSFHEIVKPYTEYSFFYFKSALPKHSAARALSSPGEKEPVDEDRFSWACISLKKRLLINISILLLLWSFSYFLIEYVFYVNDENPFCGIRIIELTEYEEELEEGKD